MIHRTLWRIDDTADTIAIDHERLAAGMRLHVIHSPLTTITMQIGAQQRSYLVLEGCMGCPRDQCRLGCPTALFRRLFQSCVTGATLTAVAPPQGLASRSYTRGIFAWPDTHAQSLDSAFLQPWEDARIMVHWRRYGAHICGSALLLTSADNPDPTSVLRERHWNTLPMPMRLVTRWHQAATPPGLPFGMPWRQSLFLLLPSCGEPTQTLSSESSSSESSAIASVRGA